MTHSKQHPVIPPPEMPKPPTIMEIIELADEIEAAGLGQVDLVRAVLARWGADQKLEGPTRRQLSLLAEQFFPGDSSWREEEIQFALEVLKRWGK